MSKGSAIVTEAASKEKKKPGRKAETPVERLARLERDVEAARKAVNDAEQLKLSVIGGAVLAEAADNAEFRATLHKLLKARVTTKAGKEAVAAVLA